MLEERERGGGKNRFQHFFTSCLKGYQYTMPKRSRKPEYNEEPCYKKRRRHYSSSPSRGRDNQIENYRKIRMLQIEVDILRAQVTLLQRQLNGLRQAPPTGLLNDLRQAPPAGKKDEHSICIIM